MVTFLTTITQHVRQWGSSTMLLAGASSAFFFALQVTLTSGLQYTTSYFQSQLIIAIGLIGVLIGGLLASVVNKDLVRRSIKVAVYSYASLPLIGLAALLVSFAYPYLSIAMLTVVFVPLGFVLTGLYRFASAWYLYAAELVGALVGLVAVVILLPPLRVENVLLLLTSSAVIALGLRSAQWKRPQQFFWATFVLFLCTFTVSNYQVRYVDLALHTICNTERAYDFPGNKIMCIDEWGVSYQLLTSFGSLVDRIDIVDASGGGDFLSVMYSGTRNDLIQPFSPEEYIQDARIPLGVVDSPKTLIIGAGAEGVAKVAKGTGATDITVVEINPAVLKIWNQDLPYRDFAQAPFADATLLVEDGRTFVERTDEQYDLITLMNTHRTTNLGHFGQPDFLHTKEAFVEYFDLLTDRGYISLEEASFANLADGEIARRIATIQAALRSVGVQEPNNHLVVYQWVGVLRNEQYADSYQLLYTQILIKKQPWSESELTAFRDWSVWSSDTSSFLRPTNMAFYRALWYPDTGVNQALASSTVIVGPFISANSYTILTDDRPFMNVISPLDKSLFTATALFFVVTLLLFVGSWLRRQSVRTLLWPTYFLLIGLTYMGIEMFLLFWLQQYVGSVLLAFVLTIGGLFAASALASLYVWRSRIQKPLQLLWLVLAALGFVCIVYAAPVTEYGVWAALLFSMLMVTALGVVLAPFFPYGAALAEKSLPYELPLLVGINTLGLAAGVPLSIALAAAYGFAVMLSAVFLTYVVALGVLVIIGRA